MFSDPAETNETRIYDTEGDIALTDVQSVAFGDSSTIRSTIVPGNSLLGTTQTVTRTDWETQIGFTNGVYLENI